MKKIIQELFHSLGYQISKYYPERHAVIEAKKYFKNKLIVACEIGTFEGEHALQILKNLNVKKIYLIDPYDKYEEYKKDESCAKLNEAKLKAHKLLKNYGNKIVWVEKYSDRSIKDIKEQIDFLYIDGNHYFPYIDRDLNNYYSLVKKGGIISGHDYCVFWKDVVLAVNNFFSKKNKFVFFGIGTDWWTLK